VIAVTKRSDSGECQFLAHNAHRVKRLAVSRDISHCCVFQ
jgi:hypothetical protein